MSKKQDQNERIANTVTDLARDVIKGEINETQALHRIIGVLEYVGRIKSDETEKFYKVRRPDYSKCE